MSATQVSIKLLRQLVSRDGRIGGSLLTKACVFLGNILHLVAKYFIAHNRHAEILSYALPYTHRLLFLKPKNKKIINVLRSISRLRIVNRATSGAAKAQKHIASPLLAEPPLTDSILDGSLECARACAAAALRKNYAGHKVRPAARRSNFYQSKVTYRS